MDRFAKKAKITPLGGGFGLLLLCATPVHAQAQTDVRGSQADEVNSTDIIVTAQRREERLSDVPLSVQAQTGEALSQAGIVDSRAIERLSPSLSFAEGYNASSTSIVIRGAASLAFEGGIQPSVGVVIDGMPTARQAEFITNLTDIDRVEVLSGPQGTLFGKNSTAGVVNIVSKKPADDFEVSAEAMTTTDKEYYTRGMINVPLAPGIALRANGYYDYVSPLINNIGGPDTNKRRAYGGQAKLGFDLGDRGNFVLTGTYNRAYSSFATAFVTVPISGGLGELQRLAFGVPLERGATVVNADQPYFDKTRFYSIVGELNYKISDALALTSVTGYRRFKIYNNNDVDAGPTGVSRGRGFSPNPTGYPIAYVDFGNDHSPEFYSYWSQELRLAYSTDKADVIFGLYYQNYNEDRGLRLPFVFEGSYLGLTPGVPFYNEDKIAASLSDDTAAVFGDATYKVTDTVSVFGGLRYSHEKIFVRYDHDVFFNPVAGFFDPITLVNTAAPINTIAFTQSDKTNNLAGRAGVKWQPAPGSNFYASVNRGYKGPAVNMGRAALPGESILKPEIATAFEIGAKQRLFGNLLSLDFALYKQTIKDIQQQALQPNSVVTTLINAGDLKIEGAELNMHFRPVNHLTLDLGVAYTDAKYDGGLFACNAFQTPGIAPCTIDNNADGAPESQTLTGQRAINSPLWKVVAGITYSPDFNGPLKGLVRLNYSWHSATQHQLGDNPLTRQGGFGLLDGSIAISSDDDRWEVSIFGKNLTNQFFYSDLNSADFFIGQQWGRLSRDYKRYGGIRVKVAF